MKLSSTLTICATSLLFGCSSAPIKLTDFVTERRLQPRDAVDIAISESDRTRTDLHMNAFGGQARQRVETGPIWAQAFLGDAGIDPEFRILSAIVREQLEAAGFLMRITYTVTGEITIDGEIYRVHAEGTRAAGAKVMSAMRQAVELGILDAAHQAEALVRTKGAKATE